MRRFSVHTYIWVAIAALIFPSIAQQNFSSPRLTSQDVSLFDRRQDPDCPPCPPCFNCNLEEHQCLQFGNCTQSNGKCSCPAGFGADDCAKPLCGSLAKGKDRPQRPNADNPCKCDEGWDGIVCNLCTNDRACDPLMPEGKDGVCYTGGLVQKENHQDCDITNVKIVQMLKEKKPRATWSCNAESATCNFQFWVDNLESFYCGLDTCDFQQENQANRNVTKYQCKGIKCSCIPGRMLCDPHGLDIGDLLGNIVGPGSFTSVETEGGDASDGSLFSEPNLDGLVSQFFGDESIKLSCKSAECLYKFDVPGFERPTKKINTPLIAGVIAGCALFVVGVILIIFFMSRRSNKRFNYGVLHLSEEDDDNTQLAMDHKPTSLHFENVSYDLNGKKILSGVQGAVHPGELLAIMGASGAGKTTFLDILARKNKKGLVRGEFFVNGEKVQDDEFKNVIGFVDQEDTMLPTLTVHETIMDSALLRLPRDMSLGAKLQRVEDVEKQLGIQHIRDQVIGSEDGGAGRGISGGEKRRVGIACELVTSPRILFLDEPTSGLDAYNAYNVVECLVNLVKTYNRTVLFTIHQPRSNIVALFDQLILLAKGRAVYSGPFSSCQAYFDNIGYSCPPGFNIADYLVDLTMHAGAKSPMDEIIEAERRHTATRASSAMAVKSIPSASYLEASESQSDIDSPRPSLEQDLRPRTNRRTSIKVQQERQLFTRRRSMEQPGVQTPASAHSEEQNLLENPRETSHSWLRLSKQPGPPPAQVMDDPHQLPPEVQISNTDLEILIDSYAKSDVAASVRDDIREALTNASNNSDSASGLNRLNGGVSSGRVTSYRRIGVWTQFKILSIRTWRNIYRNPMLMLTHYAIAILLAVLLGFLFFGITDDIAGFQNRLGLFFFILALWGFSTLTSLTVFASERLLFMRERAKGYYVPISYFASKVLFDIIPLRLIPPIILGAIVYPMTGLVPAWPQFWRFIMFLVLFNFAAAAICLFIGIIFRNGGLANLIGSLVMLGSLLFAGSLLNKDSIPPAALWLQSLSIFHYGFEGLIVNEVRYLTLIDQKYGLDIEVPGAAILSSFGFNTLALTRDAVNLAIICGVFIVVAYGAMHILLVERR